jgi:hypothetical protein
VRERILAVLGALVLVGLAVFVRGKLVADDSRAQNAPPRPAAERPVVACTPDLATVCDALADAGQIAPNPPTLDLDGAATPPKEIKGWITWSPAPDIANLDARDNGDDVVWHKDMVLASAELGVLAVPSTVNCGQPVDWNCLATKAGPDLSVGVGTVTSAEGLARIAPLAPSLARDGDATDVNVDRANAILGGPSRGQDDAATMLRGAVTVGGVDAVVAPLDAAESAAATAQARSKGLRAVPGKPAVRAAVVLASRGPDLGAVAAAAKTAKPADLLSALGLAAGASAPRIDSGALWQLRKNLR